MCLTRRRDYDATTAAVSAARDFVTAATVALLHPRGWSVADDATLVVSELMTAAVEGGSDRIEVSMQLHYDHVDLSVTGHGVREPAPALAGLRAVLVDELTTHARLERRGRDELSGVACLPCEPSWTAALPCERRPP